MNTDKETATVYEDDPIKDFHLDYKMLQRLIKWNCEHNPKFKGTTTEDRARMCGISESTYKTILSGKNAKPRIDILYAIVSSFGGYIDPLVGLAPERDLDRETEHYNATFMQSMQRQLDAAQKELTEKREKISELKEQLSEARTECKGLQRELEIAGNRHTEDAEERKALQQTLYRYRALLTAISSIVVLTLAAVLIFH